jgi:thioredoxin reductase
MTSSCDVLLVGGGPSGLAAAIALREGGVDRVVVVDREPQAGGIPRHSAHTGYGLRDLRRLMDGPSYARHYVALAERAGVEVRTETFVTGWSAPDRLLTTSPAGLEEIETGAVILATGCRERPRAARLVPGTRPAGVFTTGSLQQFVNIYRLPVGKRALIVGAEHVSFSAVLTLAHAGTEIVGMVTDHSVDQSYPWLRLATAGRHRVPVLTGQRVEEVFGRYRVEAVELADLATGSRRRVECDTVVFTGNWIPDHELARLGGLLIDTKTKGPWIDSAQRTSQRGVFAAGNVLHAAETADLAALCGRYTARQVVSYLRDGRWPESPPVPVECDPPVSWVSPNALAGGGDVPHSEFILRVDRVLEQPRLEASQGGRVLWSHRYRRLRPALPIHVPARWARSVAASGDPVRFTVG